MRAAVAAWPESEDAARRKAKLFDGRLTGLALHRLSAVGLIDGDAPAPA